MHRPGSDPEAMEPRDFFCDFCGKTYEVAGAMVEGHRGSLICSACLTRAYSLVVARNQGVVVPEHVACTMCLMNKTGDYWQSPARVEATRDGVDVHPEPGAAICRWCIEKSAGMLANDAESGWVKPG
jgi:hypothetical protein